MEEVAAVQQQQRFHAAAKHTSDEPQVLRFAA
jgi:hypothetical protein